MITIELNVENGIASISLVYQQQPPAFSNKRDEHAILPAAPDNFVKSHILTEPEFVLKTEEGFGRR